MLEPQPLSRAFSLFLKSEEHLVAETYRRYGFSIPNQNPQLNDGQAPNPSDCEQSYPFHAHRGAKPETRRNKPKPPTGIESFGRPLFVLICKASPCQSRKCSEDD